MVLAVLSVMPFMVCLFWGVIFLIEYHALTKAQRVLLAFLGISAALYFCHGMFFLGHGELVPLWDIVYTFCNIVVFPVFYLYIRRLTVAGKLSPRSYMVLIPAIIIYLWTAIIYIIGGDEVQSRQQLREGVGKIVFIVQLVLVSFYGSKRLQQFDRSLEEFYSNKENRELSLFGIMTFVMLACALASTIASSLGRGYFTEHEAMLALPSCIFSAVLFTIAYVGHKQTFDADALEKDMDEPAIVDFAPFMGNENNDNRREVGQCGPTSEPQITAAIESSKVENEENEGNKEIDRKEGIDNTDSGEVSESLQLHEVPATPASASETEEQLEDSSFLRERLMDLIENERIYLDTNLKLTDVAARLHIGRSTLSSFINQNMGVSFSDFINAKRIDHAKVLIKAEPTLSLVEVSEQSGFASPSSFYRAFKKYVGVTPKDWMSRGK